MSKKEKIGKVISNKMDKTVVVLVEVRQPHKKYGKILRLTKKFKAHDPNNLCLIGDLVKIQESRPYSKEKNWALLEILKRTEEI
ncbi:MAG: 30S ribosomal protein S17 [Candidatus Melainabacteria bacterium]|nr:30S ribosomal protein S17 [Candidatus Melainabacteria bacterium]